jgi:uncharacterized membrane protein (DUF485 family)
MAATDVAEHVEHSPEFQELVRARRRFVVPATVFYLVWYLGFVLLCGYAPDFMGESVYEGLTVGYVLALSQFVMTAMLGVMYLRRANRVWDPLRERAAEVARRAGVAGEARFARSDAPAPAPEVPR